MIEESMQNRMMHNLSNAIPVPNSSLTIDHLIYGTSEIFDKCWRALLQVLLARWLKQYK